MLQATDDLLAAKGFAGVTMEGIAARAGAAKQTAYLGRLAHVLSATDTGAVFKALIAQAQHDPVFGADFRARYLDEQRRRDRLPLERAVARGELPADLDVAAETDRLVGPLYYRVLVTDEPIGGEYTDRLAGDFLRRVVSAAPQ
ncbi:TetR/AcrR family transcriptional regulator [Nonomuraea monospora]|uniref:TetR/AcrR family transcriptional regulator n=1 Tax=Nonomuraea monospora TaxID=568818 RepID=A0ABN3CAW6_9ACTN